MLLAHIQRLNIEIKRAKERITVRLKIDVASHEVESGGSVASFSKRHHLSSESTKRDSKCLLASRLESELTQLNFEENALAQQTVFLRRKIELAREATLVPLQEIINDLAKQAEQARKELVNHQSRNAEILRRDLSLRHQIEVNVSQDVDLDCPVVESKVGKCVVR